MMNDEIAGMFDLLAKLMDIHGENSFKAKSYSSAAFRIEKWAEPIAEMDEAAIRSMPGIGDSITKHIIEIVNTGQFELLLDYLEKTPPGIIELLAIKGIGPKKIGQLWQELNIQSVDELEKACKENKLIALKGFTAKTQESILQKIAFRKSHEHFTLWAKAEPYALLMMEKLQENFPDALLDFSGAYRRQMPVLEQVELVVSIPLEALAHYFSSWNKATTIYKEQEQALELHIPNVPLFTFYHTDSDTFYQTLFLHSGSNTFLTAFREKYSIPSSAKSESEIFASNQLAFVHPALREERCILDAAQKNDLPDLIKPEDVKGLIHCHSTWSDGKKSIREMAQAAMAKGLEYMVLSDHSKSAFYAKGLTPERIIAQHREVDMLNAELAPFRIFKSIESDILPNGSLDYPDDVLAQFDVVIASVHSILNMTEEKAMQRLLTAIQNPFTDILGHPTGRLLLMREGYPVDHQKLIASCVEHQVVIEINANPRRLDLDWTWIQTALNQGAMLSVNPDAHNTEGIDDIRYGILAAQKGGLYKARNLSSMSLVDFEHYIAKRHSVKRGV